MAVTLEPIEEIRDLVAFLATLQTPTQVLFDYRPGLPRVPINRLTGIASVPSPSAAKVIFRLARWWIIAIGKTLTKIKCAGLD